MKREVQVFRNYVQIEYQIQTIIERKLPRPLGPKLTTGGRAAPGRSRRRATQREQPVFRPRTSKLQTIIRSAWSWRHKADPAKATEKIKNYAQWWTRVLRSPRRERNQCGARTNEVE